MRLPGIALCGGFLLLLAVTSVWPAMIAVNVSDANPAPANPCTLAQAIYVANLANNPGDTTPTGATTIAPLSDSATTSAGSCSAGTFGLNTIDLTPVAGQTITYSAADNYWYGPNALPPIASTIAIEGHGVSLIIPNTVTRLRFFFIGADASSASTPGYNTPGPGNLTLHNLSLSGGHQLGGGGSAGESAGGGAGMGGAVFNQGALTLVAVTMHGNWATGGIGGGPSGGGGMGADADANGDGGGMGGAVPGGTAEAGSSGGGVPGGAGGGLASGLAGSGGSAVGNTSTCGNAGNYLGGSGGDGGGGGGAHACGYSGGGGGGYGGGSGGSGAISPASNGGGFGGGGQGGFPGGGINPTGGGGGGGGVGGGGGAGTNYIASTGAGGGGGFGGGGGGGFDISAGSGNGGFGGGGANAVGSAGHGGFAGGNGDSSGTGSSGGGGGLGGAIFNHFGRVTLLNGTLTNNVATGGVSYGGNSTGGSGFGGAIFNLNGTLNVSFSTLDANAADDGSAIYNLAYNGSSSVGSTSAALTLNNTILANSVAGYGHDLVVDQPANTAGGINVATANIAVTGKNLVMTAEKLNNAPTMPTFDLTSDPQLGSLGNYGGLTPTKLPKVGSPVINAGDPTGAPSTDQRGLPRTASGVDIGADQRQAIEDTIFLDTFEGY